MNKEQEQIIDEAYENYLQYTILGVTNGLDRIVGYLDNCLVEYEGNYEHFTNPSFAYGFRTHTQEEFINKCKTDNEFSEKWGIKIEERELNHDERFEIYKKVSGRDLQPHISGINFKQFHFDESKIPTKLITLTHNNETIESYE